MYEMSRFKKQLDTIYMYALFSGVYLKRIHKKPYLK